MNTPDDKAFKSTIVNRGRVNFSVAPNPFWDTYSTWETETGAIIEAFLSPDDLYVDLGGWIGPTVLHAAALGARVETFEPDPVAHEELLKNLALNPEVSKRVTVYPFALTTYDGSATLHARGKTETAGFGNSSATLIESGNKNSVQVEVRDALRIFEENQYSKAKLIKIDIEGSEYNLIPHVASYLLQSRPSLYISLHPFIFDNAKHPILSKIRALSTLLESLSSYGRCYLVRPGSIAPMALESILEWHSQNVSLLFSDVPVRLG
jgi:FkbM family methyltransferase